MWIPRHRRSDGAGAPKRNDRPEHLSPILTQHLRPVLDDSKQRDDARHSIVDGIRGLLRPDMKRHAKRPDAVARPEPVRKRRLERELLDVCALAVAAARSL